MALYVSCLSFGCIWAFGAFVFEMFFFVYDLKHYLPTLDGIFFLIHEMVIV